MTSGLSAVERAVMIDATEHDILAGVWGDLPKSTEGASPDFLAVVVLGLVDRGWIDVCRIVPWTDPNGRPGLRASEPIARDELPEALADPAYWDYPDGGWLGALTLVATSEGLLTTRL